jgi:hypothetical protein
MYAINLNAIFIALFYFTALPVLIPIVFFSLTVNFFVEKFMIIKNYSKSNYLDEKIDISFFYIQSCFRYAESCYNSSYNLRFLDYKQSLYFS